MYYYPIKNADIFSHLLTVAPDQHSMGDSLKRYMSIKIHQLIDEKEVEQIVVRGKFDRSDGISKKEKTGKLFNFIRPTATLDKRRLYLNCFPGIDYVFHYGNIVKSYVALKQKDIDVVHILPNEHECWHAIVDSELKFVPKVHTVIMGYVEGLQYISPDIVWHGTGNFLWKRLSLADGDGILLGCKHTYWGEIAGRIVTYLAMKGIKRIIYSGKLGTLEPGLVPNETIATGNSSILPNGECVHWTNLFETISDPHVYSGTHITVPSVLQETKSWLAINRDKADFVDPEIGHMALAAQNCKIQYSYLHIISDNLSTRFDADLSNERENHIIKQRKRLCEIIGEAILAL